MKQKKKVLFVWFLLGVAQTAMGFGTDSVSELNGVFNGEIETPSYVYEPDPEPNTLSEEECLLEWNQETGIECVPEPIIYRILQERGHFNPPHRSPYCQPYR